MKTKYWSWWNKGALFEDEPTIGKIVLGVYCLLALSVVGCIVYLIGLLI